MRLNYYQIIKTVILAMFVLGSTAHIENSFATDAPVRDLTKFPCYSYTEPCGKILPRDIKKVEWEGELGDIERGKTLSFSVMHGNCLACHEINGGEQPGTIGPSLLDYGSRGLPYEYTYQRIFDTRLYNPIAHMPLFGTNEVLTDQEIRDIMAFLYSFTTDNVTK